MARILEVDHCVAILSGMSKLNKPGRYLNIEVTNVTYENSETGEKLTWDRTGNDKAIINFKATTPLYYEEGMELAREGYAELQESGETELFDEACNCNLSFSMNADKAREIEEAGSAHITLGMVHSERRGMDVLGVKKAVPTEIQEEERTPFEDVKALLLGDDYVAPETEEEAVADDTQDINP